MPRLEEGRDFGLLPRDGAKGRVWDSFALAPGLDYSVRYAKGGLPTPTFRKFKINDRVAFLRTSLQKRERGDVTF